MTDTSAKVVLHWEKLKVPFTVEVDTPKLVVSKANEAVRWQTPLQAAGYCIQNNTCLDDAGRWIDASIALAGELLEPARQGAAARQEERSQGRRHLRREGARRGEDRAAAAEPPAGQGSGGDGRGLEEGEVRPGESGTAGGSPAALPRSASHGRQLHHRSRQARGSKRRSSSRQCAARADPHRRRPRAARHLQIVGRVADHQRLPRADPQLVQDVEEHLRVGLREGLVHRAGGVEAGRSRPVWSSA